jgi:DNA-binding transcriptional MerR regulator
VDKAPEAFRTITEASEELDLPAHVLRFWEGKFAQLRPLKRAGGRRLYRPDDIALLRGIRDLIYADGQSIKAVQRMLRDQGPAPVRARGREGQEGLAPVPAPRRVSASGGPAGAAHDLPPWDDEDTIGEGADADSFRDDPEELAADSFGDDGWDDGSPPAGPADGEGFAEGAIPASVQFNARPDPHARPEPRPGPGPALAPAAPASHAPEPEPTASGGTGAGAVAPGFALRRALARLEEARAILRQVARP